jgi:D-alanine--poly(phosphoribitol) ligase subunit 2
MTKDSILDILTELRPEFDFTENVNFIEEGMLDSFDVVSLVAELEKKFGVKIEGVDVVSSNFATLDSIIALVEKSRAK